MLFFMIFLLWIIFMGIYYWFVEKNDDFFRKCRNNLRIDDIFW